MAVFFPLILHVAMRDQRLMVAVLCCFGLQIALGQVEMLDRIIILKVLLLVHLLSVTKETVVNPSYP